VFLPDGVSSHVMVDEQMNTDHLCRLVMKRRNVPLMTSWSILEQLPELFMGTTSTCSDVNPCPCTYPSSSSSLAAAAAAAAS